MVCVTLELTQLPGTAPTVGGRIRQARRYRDFNQVAFAEAIEASRQTIINWEKGRFSPTVDDLIKIAQATRFPVTWFVEGLDAAAPGPPDGGEPKRLRGWGSNPRPADEWSEIEWMAAA